ncbi:MAG: hypothetical protein AAGF12_24950 [Myxococcota bacterium]
MAACGESADPWGEFRYGEIAAELCGPATQTDRDVSWRSLAPGSSFTASCTDPGIPVCVGYAAPSEEVPTGLDREYVQVIGKLADPSRGRAVSVPFVEVAQGRVAVGSLPLVRQVDSREVFTVEAAFLGGADNSSVLPAEGVGAIARRVEAVPNDDGSCTYTVLPEEPPPVEDRLERLCGSAAFRGDSAAAEPGLRFLMPQESRHPAAAFAPSGPVHYYEFPDCAYVANVSHCVEILDPEVRFVSVRVEVDGARIPQATISRDVIEREGRRWAVGVVPFFNSDGGLMSRWELEGFSDESPIGEPRYSSRELNIPVPGIPPFQSCERP